VGLGILIHFTVKNHFTCIDEAASSNMFKKPQIISCIDGLLFHQKIKE
jgi:hypothetical protein